jgi:hypothetical protein
MGQQQLLLIILGVVVVGIAITIGLTMFSDNAVSSNRDAMSTDMMHLAAKARHYYGRPISMGGGSHSFVGITMDKLVTSGFADNVNGRYSISTVSATEVVFLGIGKVPTGNSDSTKLVLRVLPSGPASLSLLNEE